MPPKSSALQAVQAYLTESARVKEATARDCAADIIRAADVLVEGFRNGGKLLLCGNGGSAADCQHLAAELVSVLHRTKPRPALPAIALTTDSSFLTASANDFGFESIFARQVEALGRPGDVVLAISTSGTSANVLAALRVARQGKLKTIALTGRSGDAIDKLGDVTIRVPSDATQHIQEAHIAIGHVICEMVEREMFPKTGEQ